MAYDQEVQKRLYEVSKALIKNRAPAETPEEAHKAVWALHEALHYHEWRYYVQNDPIVSDYEYDVLFKQLQTLEEKYPELKTADSPTQRVSNDIVDEFKTAPHLIPMLSLENSYDAADLQDFDAQIRKLGGLGPDADIEYVVEPKFDGGSIALIYEDDLLKRAATRGNGVIGEEITLNIQKLRSTPLRANFSEEGIKIAELRGEALIRKDNFERINQKRGEEGLYLFANPRNAATGGLRTKDPKETAARGIETFIYQLAFMSDRSGREISRKFETHHESVEYLRSLGFKVPVSETKVCKNIQEVVAHCFEWQEKRESYQYEIDGIVVKVNNLALQARCGFTSRHPRWAIAFKFKAKQATSKLLTVEYQVGKIGSITPVAKLEPVQLAGVTVSSVSLHNEDFIKGKDIRLGDTVLVERAGDVIPYIVKPMEELRDGSEQIIHFPTFCPLSSEENIELVRIEGEAAWRCPKYNCIHQEFQRMIAHVSKDAMDIEGLSKATIERFTQLGWLKTIADIYRLNFDAIAKIEGFGPKSANNLRSAIEKAKKNSLQRVLYSLSIPQLGRKASKLISAEIRHLLELKDWSAERYTEIKEIGPILAQNAIQYFSNENNLAVLHDMERLGVNMLQTAEDRKPEGNAEGPLAGRSILFTGTLATMSRDQAEKMAIEAGASIAGGVSSKLNILVVGEKAGGKLKKAQAVPGIEILTEIEFLERVKTEEETPVDK